VAAQTLALSAPAAAPAPAWTAYLPPAAAAAAFALLFAGPAASLAGDWWTDPDAGHGLLLAPAALWLAWRRGADPAGAPAVRAGMALLCAAVLMRWLGGLAAELFTLRASMLLAGAGLVVFARGWGQLRRWWLPGALLGLSIPLPSVVVASLALPLQFQASRIGAALLEARDIPVRLAGNIIHLPGQSLFVTEACSGLRSLSALLAMGVLVGGVYLATPAGRALLVAAALPVAVLLNGVRVFLTGFLVVFVDPRLADGFLHASEGWLIFVAALGVLGLMAAGVRRAELALARRRS
jgi:exosortase